MFADVDLALRIDTAEARLSRSIALRLVPDRDAAGALTTGAFVLPIGAGFAAFARPGSPVNKVIGLGIDAPVALSDLEAVEQAFASRGEGTRVELSTLARPEVGELLTSRGYRLQGFENVLGMDLRATPASPARATDLTVEPVTDGALSPWLEVLVDGFAVSDETGVPTETFPREIVVEVTREFARSPEVRRYVARLNGEAVGAASMWVADGVAIMCGASTLASARRRGVQQALLARRVEDARAAGCDVAAITTAPGTRSQANAMRRGYHLLYTRAVLVGPPPRPSLT